MKPDYDFDLLCIGSGPAQGNGRRFRRPSLANVPLSWKSVLLSEASAWR